jgi:serine/threonine protein kinase
MAAIQNESKIPVGAILVGKYRVSREIGRGGMAAVYEALHISLNKRIAIKVLAAELSASTVVIERFFREARAAASVKSPYIVDVYDSGRLEDGRPFIAMELLEGESLYDRMARIRIIDAPTTVRVISHCAKALMKAHAAGIVHRDLKPENIFITHDENGEEIAKLLDFGLAKFYTPVQQDEKAARLTREGAVFGTPAYMSPEQVKGQGSVDHRADLWALGCMAYECLIGRPVWNTDQGVAMTFAAIAAANIPIPSKQRSDLPTSFDDWFRKALERDPNRRFQTAKELAEALAKALGSGQISLVNVSGEAGDVAAIAALAEQLPSDSLRLDDDNASSRRLGDALEQMDGRNTPGGSGASTPTSQPGNHTGGQFSGDAPPIASPPTGPPPAFRPAWTRYFMSTSGLTIAVVTSYLAWSLYLRPQVFTPIVASNARIVPTASASSGGETTSVPEGDPKWAGALEEAQRFFTAGDYPSATKKLKEAQDLGAATVARAFVDEVRIASTTPASAQCKLAAFSHPRLGIPGSVGRPSIASGTKGAVVTWTDDHEQAGHDHAYSVVIDPTGRPLSRPRDLTPEGNEVMRPGLLEVGERTLLLYWDRSGREAGVRVRWLDADGRIAGASVLVGAAKPGSYWPSIDRAPDGFYVAWQDDRARDGIDLFLRHLNSELQPTAPEIRATDYYAAPKSKTQPQVRVPSVAVASNALYVAYKLERDAQHMIQLMRIPLTLTSLATGLDQKPGLAADGGRADRELGDVEVVNEDKAPADAPTIACGTEGCFVAWHGEQGGAYAALIEPVQGRVLWRKKFAPLGGHPSLAASADGAVAVAYFEKGTVRMATLTRDGVGSSSAIARISGEQPRPWIANGRSKGEWYVAWQDYESGHTEAYAARLVCKN